MRASASTATVLSLLLCGVARPAAAAPFRVPSSTKQLVVVTSTDFTATQARLQRFERQGRAWKPAGEPFDVVVGKGGLGWGRGLYPPLTKLPEGPVKHEGDGRAPAGVFRLVEATGYAASPPAGTTLRYREATPRLRCVDDTASPEYNQLALAPEQGNPAWKSDEKMHREDDLYHWTIVVEHNRAPVERGAGSCIFLHVWRDASAPTVGCTAMPLANVETLLAWLDAKKKPLLVQLPTAQYDGLRRSAGLPELPR